MAKIILAQFAKAPIPGQVKTRLIPQYSAQQAADVHRYLVRKTAENVDRFIQCYPEANIHACENATIHYQLWGSQQDGFLSHVANEYGATFHLQSGVDLGVRLSRCAEANYKRSPESESWLILIGSDCPYLDETVFSEVVRALQAEDTDAVMVPADDGGYVLLGFKRFEASIFEGIEWSTERVAEQTLERLQALAWRCVCLSSLSDIDYAEDVQRYRINDEAFASCCE